MLCGPGDSVPKTSAAVEPLKATGDPSVVAPSLNVTVPEGEPGAVTVAVKVTFVPYTLGEPDVLRFVPEVAVPTTIVPLAEAWFGLLSLAVTVNDWPAVAGVVDEVVTVRVEVLAPVAFFAHETGLTLNEEVHPEGSPVTVNAASTTLFTAELCWTVIR
jgi:hypothetical protein